MTIFNIVEDYLKLLVGKTIKAYGYKHPKIPRRYAFKQLKKLPERWEYLGEIDAVITGYRIDTNSLRDSDGEFEVDVVECSIQFIHDGIVRSIEIPVIN